MAKFNTGSVTIDKSLEIKKADEGFYKYVGEENFISLAKSAHPADLDKLSNAVEQLKETGHHMIAYRIKRIDGKYRWILAEFEYDTIEYGGEPLISVNIQDVQGLEREINEIKNINIEYGEYFSLLDELFFVYDIDEDDLTIFIGGNKQANNIVHCSLDEWYNEAIDNDCVSNEDSAKFKSLCSDLRSGTRFFNYEIRSSQFSVNKDKEMNLIKGKTIINASRERKVIGCISVISAETKKKEINYNVEANIDAATGILNKKAITNYANKLLTADMESSVHIGIVDLDNFKNVNDTFGHLFGDEVLVTVANILKEAVAGRGVVGRIGGDEMMIVIESVESHSELRGILRTIRSNVEWAYKNKLGNVNLTTSIGVASCPEHARTYEDAFKIADKMLYRAKSKGKNRYIIYTPEVHGDVLIDEEKKDTTISTGDVMEKECLVLNLAEFFLCKEVMPYETALDEILKTFELDEINIFYDRMDRFMSEWNVEHQRVDRELMFVYSENFRSLFNKRGMAVINYVSDLQGTYNEAYKYLTSIGVESALIYRMCSTNKEGYVAYYKKNAATTGRKWTDTDREYLTFISKYFELAIEGR